MRNIYKSLLAIVFLIFYIEYKESNERNDDYVKTY